MHGILKKWMISLALLIGFPWGGCQLITWRHHLSFIPDTMGVWRVLYVSEDSWGFGPGGNETGIIVYEMPASVAESLQTEGRSYLQELTREAQRQEGYSWHGQYSQWLSTPVVLDSHWPDAESEIRRSSTSVGIREYLFRYGFYVDLDKKVEQMVNKALFSPGGYYAYGRIGIIILIPETRRIVYAYAG